MDLGEIRAPSITTGNITLATLVHRHPHHAGSSAAAVGPSTLVMLPNGALATTSSGAAATGGCYPHHVLPDHELTGAEAAAHVVLRMHESVARLSHGPEEGVGRASHVASTTVAVLTEEVASAQERAAAEAGEGGVAAAAGGRADEEGEAAVAAAGAAGGKADDDAASNAAMLEKAHLQHQHHAKLSRMGACFCVWGGVPRAAVRSRRCMDGVLGASTLGVGSAASRAPQPSC